MKHGAVTLPCQARINSCAVARCASHRIVHTRTPNSKALGWGPTCCDSSSDARLTMLRNTGDGAREPSRQGEVHRRVQSAVLAPEPSGLSRAAQKGPLFSHSSRGHVSAIIASAPRPLRPSHARCVG
eukprot:483010-Pleurochrysis_carterae.AAC.3